LWARTRTASRSRFSAGGPKSWPVLRSSTFIPPCESTLRDRLPKGEGWFYEVKLDGYRMQVHKAGRRITLYTRNGADWTERFPRLAASLTSLACGSAVIDAGARVHRYRLRGIDRCQCR
jgi:ATP-dependent DNA ligase